MPIPKCLRAFHQLPNSQPQLFKDPDMLAFKMGELHQRNPKLCLPNSEAKGKLKRGRPLFRLVGGGWNKQGNLQRGLFGVTKAKSGSFHLPVSIFKAHREAFLGFSHIYHPHRISNTLLSQSYVLKMAPTVGMEAELHSNIRERVRSFVCLDAALGSTSAPVFSMTSSNTSSLRTDSYNFTCFPLLLCALNN